MAGVGLKGSQRSLVYVAKPSMLVLKELESGSSPKDLKPN